MPSNGGTPPETPAERSSAIMAETVQLRDVEGSLPRIVAELARSNALNAEAIRLHQHQLALMTRCVDLLAGQMTNGQQVQMKMLDSFGEMFKPILDLMTEKRVRPPTIAVSPTLRQPVEHRAAGLRVTADPDEAQTVEG